MQWLEWRKAGVEHPGQVPYFGGMSTVLEIEKAIEQLPTHEMLELAGWLEERTSMIAASENLFQMLDEEEGEEGGSQWLG